MISSNPLINSLFNEYKDFKKIDFVSEDVAVDRGGNVNLETLALIRDHNKKSFSKVEKFPYHIM
jgi:hypothetical protein